MPKIQWKYLSNMKHAVSQERVIICGVILRLEKINEGSGIDFSEDIKKFKKLDLRFQEIESDIVETIENAGNGDKKGK